MYTSTVFNDGFTYTYIKTGDLPLFYPPEKITTVKVLTVNC